MRGKAPPDMAHLSPWLKIFTIMELLSMGKAGILEDRATHTERRKTLFQKADVLPYIRLLFYLLTLATIHALGIATVVAPPVKPVCEHVHVLLKIVNTFTRIAIRRQVCLETA